MKTLIAASLLTVGLFTGAASAADVSNQLFSDINAAAPRAGTFEELNATAPRGVFDDISTVAPRTLFDDIHDSAPRSDGVYGTLETGAP